VLVAFITSHTSGGPTRDARAEHTIRPSERGFASTGLKTASTIRLNKLATIHRRLVQRRLGRIGSSTAAAVAACLRYVFDL
jgi:mRNA-degrading endonuclease toxin of MazEF toxin-antitoxin module